MPNNTYNELREKQEILKKSFTLDFAGIDGQLNNVSGKVIAEICNWWLSEFNTLILSLQSEIEKLKHNPDYTCGEGVLCERNLAIDSALKLLETYKHNEK